MANPIGDLINAVNSATTPEGRQAAASALNSMLTEAAKRGQDIGSLVTGVFGGGAGGVAGFPSFQPPPIGPAQLAAIGQLQKILADIATGTLVPSAQIMGTIMMTLVQFLQAWQPAMPGAPGQSPWPAAPGLPFPIPNIPGLDPCKFIKCLASSMDCSGATTGGGAAHAPDAGYRGNDPVGELIGTGLDVFTRARAIAEGMLKEAEQRAADLLAAEKAASSRAKAEIEKARKEADKNATDLRNKRDQLNTTIGAALAQSWPVRG